MMKIEKYAPVIMFVFNRPTHVQKLIDSLKANEESKRTDVFIFSDAALKTEDEENVKIVRKMLSEISGFQNVTVVERSENYGLARNIIEGVSDIVSKYGKAIILEDDIEVSKYFLRYMNEALQLYEDAESVMAVSGYCEIPRNRKKKLPTTFFLPWFDCWGWATWDRAWKYFEKDPQKLVDTITDEQKKFIDINVTAHRWGQVENNLKGRINTWAIFFYVQIILHEGLVLYCNQDMCRNIGNDGSGTDGGLTNLYSVKQLTDHAVNLEKIKIERCKKAENELQLFYRLLPIRIFFEKVHRKLRKVILAVGK